MTWLYSPGSSDLPDLSSPDPPPPARGTAIAGGMVRSAFVLMEIVTRGVSIK